MAKFKRLQTSFVSGEFDPTLFGRADIEDYATGASKLRNVYVRPQGGAFRREGLEYFNQVNNDDVSRIIPFQFNDEQTYILVFTAGRLEVYATNSKTVVDTITTSPVSNITEAMLFELNWAQTADTLILVHKDLEPIEIKRTSATTFTATNLTLTNIPPFAYTGINITTPAGWINPDVAVGIVTVIGNGTNFTSGDYEGQFLNLPKGGRIYVKEVISPTELKGVVRVELAGNGGVSNGDWELESGYEDVINATKGWPRSVTFHKSRLVFGGFKSRPQTLLMSKVGDFFNFDIGEALDDEAIDVTINDSQVNIIRNIFSGRGLNIFTSGGEFSMRNDFDRKLTPSNVADQIQRETRHGSSRTRPASVDGAVVFVEGEDPDDSSKGRILRQFVFNDTEQSFVAPNISLFSQHLINNPKSMDIRRSTKSQPSNYLYIVNDDGTCAVLNSLREQSLQAYSLFETDGNIEDVAVSGNTTFFIVKRSINGSDVRYIERLNADHFMDSSILDTSVSATKSWSGLGHLDGETVSVRGDDFILGDEEVSSGAITSDEAVEKLEAGINFRAKVTSLPLDIILQGQSFLGEHKGASSANIRLHESRNIVVNYKNNTSKPSFRNFGSGVLNQPISLFSGYKKVYLGGIDREVEVEITQDEPLEFNILAINFEIRIR